MRKRKLFICSTFILALGCFVLTGCGNTNNSTSGNNTQAENNTADNNNTNNGNNAGNAVGNAVEDIADGVGNAVEDITSGFTNYGDAHDYFLNRMRNENANAQFELRNESQELTTYDGTNQGYHFELYDTATNSEGEKVGDFYLEPNSGKIYQKDSVSGEISEYQFSNNGTTGTNQTTGNNTQANQ